MKIRVFVSSVVFVLLLSFILSGCSSNKITVENDVVKGVQKTQLNTYYSYNQLKRNQTIYWQNLVFNKDKDKNGINTYMIYDIVTLPSSAYDLDDKAYIVFDNEVFELKNSKTENNYFVIRNEITEEIMTADSTKTTVLKGYDENHNKTIRMQHLVSSEMADRFILANQVFFRYYSGPNTITTTIKPGDLRKIKKVFQP